MVYHSQIKPHLTIISDVSEEMSQKGISIQFVRLSVKVCCLHLYTIKLLSFSFISAKFEAQFDFIKLLDPIKDDRQRKNGCLCQQIYFDMAVFDDRS